jgi:hypothetical protein
VGPATIGHRTRPRTRSPAVGPQRVVSDVPLTDGPWLAGAPGYSLHPIEGRLQDFEVAGVTGLGPARFNPLPLQCVLGRTIDFVEDAEIARERSIG